MRAGDRLGASEAMKMENILLASRDALVAELVARKDESLSMNDPIAHFARNDPPTPFHIPGVRQVAIGGPDNRRPRPLWVDVLGLDVIGNFASESENVDEDICLVGCGMHVVEIDLMQPLDAMRKPGRAATPLSHTVVDDLSKSKIPSADTRVDGREAGRRISARGPST